MKLTPAQCRRLDTALRVDLALGHSEVNGPTYQRALAAIISENEARPPIRNSQSLSPYADSRKVATAELVATGETEYRSYSVSRVDPPQTGYKVWAQPVNVFNRAVDALAYIDTLLD